MSEEAPHLRGRRAGVVCPSLLSLAVMGSVGVLALILRKPLLFPSLGPTVMLFFDAPKQPESSPRNTIVGHLVGLAAGAGCLYLLGLADHPSVLREGVDGQRIAAAALSVAVTTLVLSLLSRPHPPAGATTLVVSLGLLPSPPDWLWMISAVIVLTALAAAANRLRGIDVPLWY